MSRMRRKDKEITERQVIEEILYENDVGRLATSVDDQPYVVPVNYVYFDEKIYFHSHKDGTKMQNIFMNPRVCFEVDSGELLKKGEKPCDYTWKYTSAIIRGRANIISDLEKRIMVLKRFSDKYAPGKGKMLTAEDLAKNPQLVIVEISVDEITGKRSGV